MERFRRICAFLCCAVLLLPLAGIPCGCEEMELPGLRMNITRSGSLQIERTTAGYTPMGRDGTWTVFVYLCGTDLESESGMATRDLQEMLSASTGSNVRFVVQTAGTARWKNREVSNARINRYVICNGTMTLEDTGSNASMGSAKTLSDFLLWGVRNYPAAKMGVVFWDHGGGSISGVCFDELYGGDSLTLSEINGALAEVSAAMTDQFEFIGFDACMMGTVESANILASYSRYMYGSEETEPGYGWDYASMGSYLGRNPNATGAELGKVICDSFFDMCRKIGEERSATFSVTDLSKINDVVIAFNDFAKSVYEVSEDVNVLSQIVRAVNRADHFGGNSKSEGYSNMVDLAGVVSAGEGFASNTAQVLRAIDAAVIYRRSGSRHSAACGLATYFPLCIQGNTELKIFGEISISPYYLSFVDRSAYGLSNSGNTENYQTDWIFDLWDVIWGSGSDWNWMDAAESWDTYGVDEHYDSLDFQITGQSPLIVFENAPALMEDGSFGFSLTNESLGYVSSVQGIVYTLSEDGADLIELGVTADLRMDWEMGVFMDNFDGYWFSLPDGQNLAVYLVEECDGYDVYTTPVLVNGEKTNLRLSHHYAYDGSVYIEGIWDGIDENGMAGRNLYSLRRGDVIVPLYYASSISNEEEYFYYGSKYVYRGNPEIFFDLLFDGEFYFGFNIDDVYGDYYMTDYVSFVMEDGEVYFYDE